MSWISDDVEAKIGEEEVAVSQLYPGVGKESILRATRNADVSSPNALTAGRQEDRRFGPLMVNLTPNVRPLAPAG